LRRVVVVGLAIMGLAAGVFVAQLGWSAGAHQPSVFEWLIQLAVLVVAGFMVASRVTGKS
jgi:hypothetical protein